MRHTKNKLRTIIRESIKEVQLDEENKRWWDSISPEDRAAIRKREDEYEAMGHRSPASSKPWNEPHPPLGRHEREKRQAQRDHEQWLKKLSPEDREAEERRDQERR